MGCTVSFHVLPHIRKYLMVMLAPGEHLSEPGTHDLVVHFSTLLGSQIMHAELDSVLRERPRSSLSLEVVPGGASISAERLKGFNYFAERTYRSHSHRWMDWYMLTFKSQVRDTIWSWRARYGITEADQSLWTAEKAYLRHRVKSGNLIRPGGHRPPSRYDR